jgi:DNA-directed RNA polymerase specialized sigma subunit
LICSSQGPEVRENDETIRPAGLAELENITVACIWLREMLAKLTDDRERWVTELYLVNEMTVTEISGVVGVSRQRVSQILHGEKHRGAKAYESPGTLRLLRETMESDR